jgi:hypothetical protein
MFILNLDVSSEQNFSTLSPSLGTKSDRELFSKNPSCAFVP